jgi:hypothetical protein
MRSSFIVLAIILGCAITQSTYNPCRTGKCASCFAVSETNSAPSCEVCSGLWISAQSSKGVAGQNECTRSTATNCFSTDSSQTGFDTSDCYYCNPGYDLDISSNQCVPSKNKIQGCAYQVLMQNVSQCLYCTGAFTSVLGDGLDCNMPNSIPNCAYSYGHGSACQFCEDGYGLSIDRTSCIQFTNGGRGAVYSDPNGNPYAYYRNQMACSFILGYTSPEVNACALTNAGSILFAAASSIFSAFLLIN